jgi:hypothetical protein
LLNYRWLKQPACEGELFAGSHPVLNRRQAASVPAARQVVIYTISGTAIYW